MYEKQPFYKGAIYFNHPPDHYRREPTKAFKMALSKCPQERLLFLFRKREFPSNTPDFILYLYSELCLLAIAQFSQNMIITIVVYNSVNKI